MIDNIGKPKAIIRPTSQIERQKKKRKSKQALLIEADGKKKTRRLAG